MNINNQLTLMRRKIKTSKIEKTRRFPDEGETVQAAWTDCLLDYCDRARESDWKGIPTTDEIGKAFAAGLKAGREQR